MRYVVCAVFDQAAEAYGRPFFAPAMGLAVRSFIDEVNRPSADNSMHQHAGDYALFHLGHFDDGTGQFALLPVPVRISVGEDVLAG